MAPRAELPRATKNKGLATKLANTRGFEQKRLLAAVANRFAAAPRHISLYDGRDLIGTVHGAGKEWRAFDARGNPVPGKFKSVGAAVAAVNSSLPSSCVCDANARRDNSS